MKTLWLIVRWITLLPIATVFVLFSWYLTKTVYEWMYPIEDFGWFGYLMIGWELSIVLFFSTTFAAYGAWMLAPKPRTGMWVITVYMGVWFLIGMFSVHYDERWSAKLALFQTAAAFFILLYNVVQFEKQMKQEAQQM